MEKIERLKNFNVEKHLLVINEFKKAIKTITRRSYGPKKCLG